MGGTAGLFLGASLLTLVELVYYACRTPSYKLSKEREASRQQRKQALMEAKQAAEARGWSRLREDHRATATVRQVQPALVGVVNLPARNTYASAYPSAYNHPARKPVQDPFDLYM